MAFGLMRRSRGGLGIAATGGMMLYRGLGGHCLSTARSASPAPRSGDEQVGQLGVKLEREIPVDEQPEKVYAFWRDLRNLPIIMPNLESVEVISDHRSHWRVKGPAGTTFEWTAEIINDKPNELIAWRRSPAPGSRTPGPSISFPARAAARSSGFPCNTIHPAVS